MGGNASVIECAADHNSFNIGLIHRYERLDVRKSADPTGRDDRNSYSAGEGSCRLNINTLKKSSTHFLHCIALPEPARQKNRGARLL